MPDHPSPPDAPFRSLDEFVRSANAWVCLLLRRQIQRARAHGLLPLALNPSDVFAGAYISDNEVEVAGYSLLRQLEEGSTGYDAPPAQLDVDLERVATALRRRLEATRRAAIRLPFLELCDRLQLTAEEGDFLLLVCTLAADARARRMLAYLQNDLSRRRPDVGTALSLLASSPNGAMAWHLLEPDGALRSHQLVSIQQVERERGSWLMERTLLVPDAIVAFVMQGQRWLDEGCASCCRLISPDSDWEALEWPQEPRDRLRRRMHMAELRVSQTGESSGMLLRGPRGGGKKAAALAFCRERGRALLVVDPEHLPADEDRALTVLRTIVRDARLHAADLFVEHADSLRREEAGGAARLNALRHVFRRAGMVFFFGTELETRIDLELMLPLISLTLPVAATDGRVRLWQAALPAGLDPEGQHARTLAELFSATPGLIREVGADIRALHQLSPDELDQKTVGRLLINRAAHNLHSLASPVRVSMTWEDVVLSPQLRERCARIVQFARHRATLQEAWGFGRKLLPGNGISALFSGPPGVGKTMLAGIIAAELGVDAYRIDLSQMLSKWVGETEKNLARLFDEAARGGVMLVFDEADALFSRRTEVSNASDRYSNVEVNYLLQRMESFEGIVVLTTNLERGIDEAFVRRLNFRIRIPAPTVQERREMWRRMLPPEVRYAEDVSLEELAARLNVTGGFIRNALVRAALIAAAEGDGSRCLTRKQVTQAVSEELEEAGRLSLEVQAGKKT
jgi:AAA+ superfamily predicted ATPase